MATTAEGQAATEGQAPQQPEQAVTNPAPPSGAGLPFTTELRAGRLANGLRWYVRQNGEPQKRAELRLAVRVGSISEQEHERGIAHIVEHLAFRATALYPERQDVVNFLEGIGAQFGPCQNACKRSRSLRAFLGSLKQRLHRHLVRGDGVRAARPRRGHGDAAQVAGRAARVGARDPDQRQGRGRRAHDRAGGVAAAADRGDARGGGLHEGAGGRRLRVRRADADRPAGRDQGRRRCGAARFLYSLL